MTRLSEIRARLDAAFLTLWDALGDLVDGAWSVLIGEESPDA